jgi:hypothetical protein
MPIRRPSFGGLQSQFLQPVGERLPIALWFKLLYEGLHGWQFTPCAGQAVLNSFRRLIYSLVLDAYVPFFCFCPDVSDTRRQLVNGEIVCVAQSFSGVQTKLSWSAVLELPIRFPSVQADRCEDTMVTETRGG